MPPPASPSLLDTCTPDFIDPLPDSLLPTSLAIHSSTRKTVKWKDDLEQEIHPRSKVQWKTETPSVYYVNGTKHALNTSCSATIHTPRGIATRCCLDTGTQITLLAIHWPDLPVSKSEKPVSLSGISAKGNDKVMYITCKVSKFISYLVGKITYAAEDWADKYYSVIYSFWGFPDKIISDQDSKFMGRFWRALFQLAKVQLAFTAAHHSAGNGQADTINQTGKLYYLASNYPLTLR